MRTRREFLSRLALGTAASAAWAVPAVRAVEPFHRPGVARLRLGLAAYSFIGYFRHSSVDRRWVAPEERRIDLLRFLDFCADHGCDGAELTAYFFPPGTDNAYLARVRRHAFLRGLAISGTAVGNTFTHPAGAARDAQTAMVKDWIDRSAVLGAPHVRVFAGATPPGLSDAEAKRNCLAALEECCEHAGARGIFLGLENHHGIVTRTDELLDIVRTVKSPWLGINLDSANFHTADPYADFERCAPYAVNVQMKAEVFPGGKGAGPGRPADLPRLVKILRDVRYQGFVALEYESSEDPWDRVPKLLAELRPLLA